MNDDWRRDPNVIEGEYEIIGEWMQKNLENQKRPHRNRFRASLRHLYHTGY